MKTLHTLASIYAVPIAPNIRTDEPEIDDERPDRRKVRRDARRPDIRRSSLTCGHPAPCGCEYGARCCFDCPLPECNYVAGISGPRTESLRRAREAEALRRQGFRAVEIARRIGVSRRTVYRLLELDRSNGDHRLKEAPDA